MQKLLCTILLLTYLVVGTGFTVNLHYCMGRFHSWELGDSAGKECARCGMSACDSEGCCRDEVKTFKLHQDLPGVQALVVNLSVPPLVSYVSPVLVAQFQNWNLLPPLKVSSPPFVRARETYLENCVFRL